MKEDIRWPWRNEAARGAAMFRKPAIITTRIATR